jgi:hypothetical protein
MAKNQTNVDPRYLSYDKGDVERILQSVDGKVLAVTEFSADQVSTTVSEQMAAALTAMRTRYGNNKSLVLVPTDATPTGYIPATVTENGSTFSMYYFFNGRLWTLTGSPQDTWAVTSVEMADASKTQVATEEEVRDVVRNYTPEA